MQRRQKLFLLSFPFIFVTAVTISGLVGKGQDIPGANLRTLTYFGIATLGILAVRQVLLRLP